MNIEVLRSYCLSLPEVTEELPFGPDTLVFKVKGKIFLLTSLDSPDLSFNVKCDPEKAIRLREEYADVHPGYHMNKKHWNTISITGSIPSETIMLWIKESYQLVVKGLPKSIQNELKL
ncbi:MmcQ/YjbR family DNA-binding protein [Dyadobacter tibetensis]|uniref:MmcQ/YjbR family DNA-binding protein n=1 Tax=Dyadobacter tibetensis TaxID=1211851 RepID=UPI00046F7150|nr:MmcQ/YjbR family DNA-binding protein [Dyadobacter tibetensis]